jgi:hypothetical protein
MYCVDVLTAGTVLKVTKDEDEPMLVCLHVSVCTVVVKTDDRIAYQSATDVCASQRVRAVVDAKVLLVRSTVLL